LLWFVVDEVVMHVNLVIQERVRAKAGREATVEPMPGPRLSVRSAAAERGDEVPPVAGIQHKRSAQYELRQDAQRMTRMAQELERQWWEESRRAWWEGIPYDEAPWRRRVEQATWEAGTAWAHAHEVRV